MEFTYAQLDTVKTQQQLLMERLDLLERQMALANENQLQTNADTGLLIQDIRLALEQLGFRIEDNSQLLQSLQPTQMTTRPVIVVDSTLGDSLGLYPDSTAMVPGPGDSEADRLFKGSYMDLTLGNYDLAIQGFKNFLVRYPNARTTPDAHYYVGECFYSTERYLEAVAEYQTVIKEYGSSRFVPASYLKSAYCYQYLEERHLADAALRELVARYPRTEEAEQARVALDGGDQ